MITLIQRRYICEKGNFRRFGNGKLPPSTFLKIFAFRSTFFVEFVPFVIVSGIVSRQQVTRAEFASRRKERSTFGKKTLIKRIGNFTPRFPLNIRRARNIYGVYRAESIGLTL